ncbi:hypothetical protein OS493_001902 [Desmophyllum pertusum]|uniref:Uncharacterized protein n=1 Tax=Desmophyllum pertusum TaxID=174260 RepID=A0A9X0CVR5_9CNID|nr:hypothetical protein OS493_001902 [Desmophyllum pertusum]
MTFHETVKQVLCLVLCLSLVREQKSLLCEDEPLTPPGIDDPLTEFSSYFHRHLPGPDKIYFQQLSVTECAHLCLQLAGENMFNCSSFEHVTITRDCLLMGFACEDHKLIFDSSRHFYQLKGPNGTISCATISSSSSVPPSFIHPTSTIQTPSVVSSIVANKDSTGNHNLSIQVALLLTNESWKGPLINRSSHVFMNISSRIKQNVFQTLDNITSLLGVSLLQLRNASGLVAAEFSLTFSQEFHLRDINQFYSSLYEAHRLGLMPIDVINDTLPGKPPQDMNVSIISPTALHLSWSPGETLQVINTWGLRILYKATDNKTHSILVDKKRAEVNISRLQPDTRYTIWAVRITSKGFGFPSQALNITTPYQALQAIQDIIINLKVLLINVTWDTQFENRSSEVFTNLSSVIENSVKFLHQNDSSYKNISSLRFSSKMENLYDIYEALYKEKRLQELQIEVIDDNIPGKPPTNITSLALSPSSITVNWNPPRSNHCEIFPLVGFRAFYAFTDNKNVTFTHFTDVNKSNSNIVIQNLENFEYYLIWLQTKTSRGLGPKSKAVETRTLEKVVSVNVMIQLNVPWVQALLNTTSEAFKNVTTRIERNVYLLYENKVQLRRVVCHTFINDSGKVAAEVEITFGQHVQVSAFILLYKELYENGTMGNMTVTPISDNIPGKPPTNLSVEAISPTSVLIRWKFPSSSYEPIIPTSALRIFYELQGDTTVKNIKDTNATTGFVVLDKLEKFAWYTVWVKSVTSRGLGVESERFKIQTLEEVVPINTTVRLTNKRWTDDLSNTTSEAFRNLSRILEINAVKLYVNDTHLRGVVIHRFRY